MALLTDDNAAMIPIASAYIVDVKKWSPHSMSLWKCKEKKEWLIELIIMLILFFFATYRLSETKQPIVYSDEFGYWANSSFWIGQDWSAAAKSINYYSYGYSLLLLPIQLLARMCEWNYAQMFQMVIIMHALMLIGNFFIARKLCIRYLRNWNWYVRDFSCFVVMLYPSIIVYSHLTLTEAVLAFLFWLYFYVMMCVTDKGTIANYICFAIVSFYMYTVHQRCIAVIIASVLVVMFLKLENRNRMHQVVAFFAVLCIGSIVHQCVKYKLQNDLYLANVPIKWAEALHHVWNIKTLLIILGAAFCLLILYLVDKGKGRTAILISTGVIIIVCILLTQNIDNFRKIAENADARLATNDFAGQIVKVLGIFTPSGFLRFLVSIAGKWYYLATASGFVICFALLDLSRRFVFVVRNYAKVGYRKIRNLSERKEVHSAVTAENIWYFGVFLIWLGIFGVCVLYKIDIWRVDSLVYGRYQEAVAGLLLLYGFYVLFCDKKWLRHLCIFLCIYLLTAWICQNALMQAGSDSFQKVHSIMLSRVFQDNEIPYFRVWEAAGLAVLKAIVICIILKTKLPDIRTIKSFFMHIFESKNANIENKKMNNIVTRKHRNMSKQQLEENQLLQSKSMIIRQCLILLGFACVWGYMGIATVEDYVIPVNKNIERSMPEIAEAINKLALDNKKETIYFLRDTSGYRMGLVLQFYLPEKQVVITTAQEMLPNKEAFYVTGAEFGSRNTVREQFFSIAETPDFTLLVPQNGALFERFMQQ